MIKSSKHTIRFANIGKRNNYLEFIYEYRRVASLYLDYLWENGWSWKVKDKDYVMNISNDQLNHPRFIYKEINDLINLNTILSARALKCCIDQVCGIIGSALEKRRKSLWLISKLKVENKPTFKLEQKLQPVVKPNVSNINPELNSICCDFQLGSSFDGFLQLKCIGKSFGKIRIPIKFHRSSNKWRRKGKMMPSFLLGKTSISIRWDIEKPQEITTGITVGADQGKLTLLTLSNNTITQKTNAHGYSLDEIIKVLSRKRKGSKAFHKAQEHRKNFINWSINNLNLNGIKEIRLEKILNIGFGKRKPRNLSHWTNTLIRDKIISSCEELGVQVVLQDATYRSQRCSHCGMVRKANRKGKIYLCNNCGLEIDADLNAAKNHEQNLPKVPIGLRGLRRNLGKGFLWKPNGFFEITGEALPVPLSNNER